MTYELYIIPSARKQFKKLPASVQKTINKKLDSLCISPFTEGMDIKKLQGREGYRLRIGNYRVIYNLEKERLVITVISVGHRKEIYQ